MLVTTAEQPSVGAGSATHPASPSPGERPARFQLPGVSRGWGRGLLTLLLALLLLLPGGCSRLAPARSGRPPAPSPLAAEGPSGRLQEVAPPTAVQQLQPALAEHTPQLTILAPRDGADLPQGPVNLQLQVRDWPLVDAGTLGLGPHVVVQVDDQEPRRLTGPLSPLRPDVLQLELPPLSPGSHRITAYAARPWGEAVKSPGAWDQVRVQRVAANPLAIPQPGTPQLIAVSPADLAGREPILLDWLLLDAPLQGLRDNDGSWRLRVTVNGDSFLVDQNAPLWLKGWRRGSNSLLLELVDGRGEPLNPPFNTVVSELVLAMDGPAPSWQQGRLGEEALAQLLGKAPPATPNSEAQPETEPEPEGEPQPEGDAQQRSGPQIESPAEPAPQPTSTVAPDRLATEAAPSSGQPVAAPPTQPEPADQPEPAAPTEPQAESQAESQPTPGPVATAAPQAEGAPPDAAPRDTAPRDADPPRAAPANPGRIAPSSSLQGAARNQVNPDGSLLKPKPSGPLAGLRQKLGA